MLIVIAKPNIQKVVSTEYSKAQTLSKTHNNPSPLPNEDRISFTLPNIWAVADGAGGTGILCGEWAEFLLAHLPSVYINSWEAFIAWIEPLAEAFIQEYEPLIQHDSFQLKRFYQEGSACTLAVVWQVDSIFHWLTFGDSHVFFYANNQLQSYPFQSTEELSGGTHLLNCSIFPNELGFRCGSFEGIYNTCLLATDAISKHILLQYQTQAEAFDIFIETLTHSLESPESFWQYIQHNPTIEEDDYSLIIIRP
ncbi:protein phosphatase 2C domain-containing protein [Flectobacillus major]|uniref:protein phosphatase 2C domain-containing protein n=1 Tax=Flectobacillus major TaxID=103 RepID=UPI0004021A64|nr:protein phosphatase 2C domain-containing protein [Flectobacillus major]